MLSRREASRPQRPRTTRSFAPFRMTMRRRRRFLTPWFLDASIRVGSGLVKRRWAVVAGLAVAAAAIVWRIGARGRGSAFPAWLGWSLANPLADRLFGTT